MEVKVAGDLEGAFARFGNGHAYKLADKTLRIVAYRYRSFLKKEYLSGQMLGQRTGALVRSIVVGRKKGARLVYLVGSKKVKNKKTGETESGGIKLVNIYERPGGYTIRPKNMKALSFEVGSERIVVKKVEGRSRPFMTESSKAFDWPAAFDKSTDEVIEKELKRLAKEGVYVPGGLD